MKDSVCFHLFFKKYSPFCLHMSISGNCSTFTPYLLSNKIGNIFKSRTETKAFGREKKIGQSLFKQKTNFHRLL